MVTLVIRMKKFTWFTRTKNVTRQINMTTIADMKYANALHKMSSVATELMIRANEANNPAQAYSRCI